LARLGLGSQVDRKRNQLDTSPDALVRSANFRPVVCRHPKRVGRRIAPKVFVHSAAGDHIAAGEFFRFAFVQAAALRRLADCDKPFLVEGRFLGWVARVLFRHE
jgi:hypothetical protein